MPKFMLPDDGEDARLDNQVAALDALLDAKNRFEQMCKARSMEYQPDLKDEVAQATGRNWQELYALPYVEWAPIRDAYLKERGA